MSRSRLIIALLAALAAQPVPAAEGAAERYVREGNAPAALEALQKAPLPREEAAYWRGRALITLGRLESAAESLALVPQGHPLFPYAARGLLYCAWRSPRVDFIKTIEPLTACEDAEIAALALAAMAEHQLRFADKADASYYDRLTQLAEQRPEFQPLLHLLRMHIYRHLGDFNRGLEYTRQLEKDDTLSPAMRQRVRLALAEMYYAKEEAASTGMADDNAESDEGKGEETLLQFITANPEAPLLEEAFRRLCQHSGSSSSEYVRTKLKDWADDTAHPKRAALALYSLQQMEHPHGADPAALVNRAAANLPGEPVTLTILQEHIRKLLAEDRHEDATPYLALLSSLQKEKDARTEFLQALSLRGNDTEAMCGFLRSAEHADGSLLTPARVNALICAMRAGEEDVVESLLEAPALRRTKRALLLAHAGMLLEKDPARAEREVEEAQTLSPTHGQQTDIRLDAAQLNLSQSPQSVLNDLLSISPEERSVWTDAQALRYAGLVEHASDALQALSAEGSNTEQLLQNLYEQSESLHLREALGLHLAGRYAQAGQHRKALHLLQGLAASQPNGEGKASTLLLAGQSAASLGSLASLKEAAALYAESARQPSPYTVRATIEQAAILVRINQTKEALSLLQPLYQEESFNRLSVEDRARLLTALADAHAMDMTPESLSKALELCQRIESLPGLPQAWATRGLLQHASICSRLGLRAQALADYQKTLQAELECAHAEDANSCFLMYYAASGAVYQLLQMERYEDAANLADAVGAWPGSRTKPADTPGPKAESFKRWAQSIRQTHFLASPLSE